MAQGELTKMVIEAFGNSDFVSDKIGSYTVMLNPEKYAQQFKSQYEYVPPVGGSTATTKFVKSVPIDLELEFMFDSTGAVSDIGIFKSEGNLTEDKKKELDEEGVTGDIAEFKHIVYDYNGDKHKPNYLKITWGTLCFQCVLMEMGIEYKLFGSNGKPIRALVKTKFKNFVAEEERVLKENKKSPDITHTRIVREGDTLHQMCYKIYGDSKYYLQVAQANGLTKFRNLRTGQTLIFPPIIKSSNR